MSGQESHFLDSQIKYFHFFTRVRRFGSKSSSRSHKMVSNDPILDSKVVTDELGQLGRPAERAGRAWPARAGQPGRPVPPAGRWAALRGEGEKREGQRRGAAHRPNPAPPLLSPQVGYLVNSKAMVPAHCLVVPPMGCFAISLFHYLSVRVGICH